MTSSINILEEQVHSLNIIVQKIQDKNQGEEGKTTKLNNILSKREYQMNEPNKLVESMQKEGKYLKQNLKVFEDGHIPLSDNLTEMKK